MWIFNRGLAKSHFYVWYLGSKEADGVRGSAVVLPAMRQLLRDSFRRTPNKATVQTSNAKPIYLWGALGIEYNLDENFIDISFGKNFINTSLSIILNPMREVKISGKGLKLIQTVPTMSKSGKIKMQLVKFQIAANSVTYSMTGKPPFDDVIAVVMLVFNPEMHSPIHVHCYRCDSAETAAIMQANLQVLIGRPETQRSIVALEQRLFVSGMLTPRRRSLSKKTLDGRLPNGVVDELKRRLSSTEQRAFRERTNFVHSATVSDRYRRLSPDRKRYSMDELPRWDSNPDPEPRLRLFGDTIIRNGKSRSVDNLAAASHVSRFPGDEYPSSRRFPRPDITDPFGRSYHKSTNVGGFWKRSQQSLNALNKL